MTGQGVGQLAYGGGPPTSHGDLHVVASLGSVVGRGRLSGVVGRGRLSGVPWWRRGT